MVITVRLIDADALIDVVQNRIAVDKEIYPDDEFSRFYRKGMRNVIGIIKNQDTVDLVKHGEWINIDAKFENMHVAHQCSICKSEFLGDASNFCPRCGAKMDQDTGGDNNGNGEAKNE